MEFYLVEVGGKLRDLELLIPAGNLENLKVAIDYGADAVYIGGGFFSLRAKAKNFTKEDMKAGIKYAHERGKKVYVTANILGHNDDLDAARGYFEELKEIVKVTVPLEKNSSDHKIVISSTDNDDYPFEVERINFPDIYGERKENIHFLSQVLPTIDFLISKEGPVDVEGFGDSVFGHFDERTKQIQRKAKKGLLRVANMVGATAISIPTDELGISYLGVCESTPSKIAVMIEKMEKLVIPQDELIERYFRNPETWFRKGYGE